VKFKSGQSGNPAGKPKGAKDKRTEMRSMIAPHADKLVNKAVEMALGGDTTALRICIDRIIPALKSTDRPVTIAELDGTLADQGRTVLAALSSGQITPEEASTLMQTVAAQARIIEITELESRIGELEKRREPTKAAG
jgi:hypothetical protein